MRPTAGVLVAVAVIVYSGTAYADPRIQLPDPKDGQINGRPAVMYWPSLNSDKELLSPDGCTVHLVPAEDESRELTYPCGVWFQPPPSRYRTWMEKGDLISAAPVPLTWVGKKFVGRGLLGVGTLVPSGKIFLARTSRLGPTEEIRLLSIDSNGPEGGVRRAFTRRISTGRGPVAMPHGRVIAGIFRRDGEIVALSRPVVVSAGAAVEVSPTTPSAGTDVLAVLERTGSKLPPAVEDPSVTLEVGSARRQADVSFRAVERIYSIWYGVEGQTATLQATSKDYVLPPQSVVLRSRHAVQYRGDLRVAPKLSVEVLGPDEAFENPVRVAVRSVSTDNLLRAPIAVTRSGSLAIPGLAAEEVLVTLECGPWKYDKQADLRSGDASLTFNLKPYVVTGVVYYGTEPSKAEVQYSVGSQWVKAAAGMDGKYKILLWKSGMYPAEVLVDGGSKTPFLEPFISIDGDDSVDFHVPKNHYIARVTNDDDEPVLGADVLALNLWRDDQSVEHRVSLQSTTGSGGDADLPPLRDGEISVFAKADGYEPSSPALAPVSSLTGGVIPIKLRRIADSALITVLLPDGAPASNADAWALRSAADQVPSWTGKCDEDGSVKIPVSAGASILLIRHPRAASMVVKTPARGERAEVRLQSPTERVAITAKDITGAIVAGAPVAIWIGEVRLTGGALAFLTFTPPYTDAFGRWYGDHLPPSPFRVLAWTRKVRYAQVASGSYDTSATRVSYPWPASAVTLAIE